MNNLIIMGCGGHGKVVLDAAKKSNIWENIIFADDNSALSGKTVNNAKVIHASELIDNPIYKDYPLVVAIGDNEDRKDVQNKFAEIGYKLTTIIHPSAIIGEGVKIGVGSQTLAGAIINSNAELAKGVIVNTGAIIEHDCKIDNFSHMGPGSVIAGGVEIGRNVLVGAGAIIQPYIKISKNVIVGSGAVVTKNVDDNQTVIGVPAEPKK